MISVSHPQFFARYNKWQNDGIIALCADLSREALTAPRGVYFGSLMATLNHLLWADRIWMSRIDGWVEPGGGIAESVSLYPTLDAWRADRERADSRLVSWADGLRPAQLRADLTWMSGALGREVTRPIGLCITHMFNHQTHHRGQIHAMLTGMGLRPQDSDLFLMPDEVW